MSQQIIIESLKEHEIVALKELFKLSGPYVTERGISDYWLYTRLFNNTCLGAKDGDNLAGALISFCDQSLAYKEIYIQDLAVLPEYRCHGVGSGLLKEIIQRAKALGVYRIWLTSEAENENAIKLWNKFGFENNKADYLEHGLWITKDLKGPGRDRAIFSLQIK